MCYLTRNLESRQLFPNSIALYENPSSLKNIFIDKCDIWCEIAEFLFLFYLEVKFLKKRKKATNSRSFVGV